MSANRTIKQFHASLLIGWASLGIVAGVAVAPLLSLRTSSELFVAGFVLAVVAFWRRGRISIVIILLAGGFFGLWRGGVELQGAQKIQPFIGQKVVVQATIMDDPAYGKRSEKQLRAGSLVVEGQSVPGKVWVSTYSILDLRRGDRIELRGKLRPGFGAFVAALSYATVTSVERPPLSDVGREIRDVFAAGIRNALPEPQASLGVGYVVGQRSALPAELDEQLLATGLTHIVVASGYNLTVLVRLGRRIFSKYSKYAAFITAAGLVTVFVLVTGFSPSMSRAALVAGLSLVAWYYGRAIHPVLLLLLAAAVTICVNPFFVWGDVGWYLSFAAFAGVLILAPLVTRLCFRGREVGFWPQLLVETVAAQVVTLPVLLYMFGTTSIISLPANLLIVPLVPVAMLFTFIAGCGGLLVPSMAGWFGVPATTILTYMTQTIETLSHVPLTNITVPFNEVALTVSYLSMVLFCLWAWRRTRYDFRDNTLIE